jgi:hypothetical protein
MSKKSFYKQSIYPSFFDQNNLWLNKTKTKKNYKEFIQSSGLTLTQSLVQFNPISELPLLLLYFQCIMFCLQSIQQQQKNVSNFDDSSQDICGNQDVVQNFYKFNFVFFIFWTVTICPINLKMAATFFSDIYLFLKGRKMGFFFGSLLNKDCAK